MANTKEIVTEPILEENPLRFVLFPIQYHKTWELYKTAQAATWFAEEVDFSEDVEHYKKLTPNEQYFLDNILAFFASADGIVNENLSKTMMDKVQVPEIRAFYTHQMFMETIHCVSGNTNILTDKGYFKIIDLLEKEVNVWNGKQFSKTTVKFTGKQDLYKVILSNGMELESTSEHKWFIKKCNRKYPEQCKKEIVFTKDLEEDDVIYYYDMPTIDCKDPEEFKNPYIHGFFCGNGSYYNNSPMINLYGQKKKLLKYFDIEKYSENKENDCIKFYIINKINEDKFFVPINYSLDTKLRWLEGLCDSNGCVNMNTTRTKTSIQITSINFEFLKKVQLMLTTIGLITNIRIQQKLHDCEEIWILYITTDHVRQLINFGFSPKGLKLLTYTDEYTSNNKLLTISSIEKMEGIHDTYCFSEPEEHAGVFNGILTGQSETYSLMIDTFVDSEKRADLFNAIVVDPVIKKIADWAIKWMNSDCNFAQNMIAFSAVEGILFSGPFCAIYWLKKQGKMPGLTFANELIARDEGQHCVAPETLILTSKGYKKIVDCVDKNIEIWNGEEWSPVKPFETGTKKLLRVNLDNGMYLDCTEKHKWLVVSNDTKNKQQKYYKFEEKFTEDLNEGDILCKYDLPVLNNKNPYKIYAYTQGLFSADGYYDHKETLQLPCIKIFRKDKKNLLQFLEYKSCIDHENSYMNIRLHKDKMKDKFFVPINHSLKTKLRWLEGYLDGDGYTHYNSKKDKTSIQVSSVNLEFLKEVQLMLTTMGCNTNVKKVKDACIGYINGVETNMQTLYVLYITCESVNKLLNIGFSPKRLKLENINNEITSFSRFIKVTSVTNLNRTDKTYCFTEEKRSMGIFNGILTKQCNFAVHVYTDLIQNKESYETVLNIIKEAVELQIEFIIHSLPCSLIGMNSNMMIEYIQFVADRLLVDLGYSKHWRVTNPFPWMELISTDTKTNFFEKKVGEYGKATAAKRKNNGKSIDNKPNDKYGVTIDEDF